MIVPLPCLVTVTSFTRLRFRMLVLEFMKGFFSVLDGGAPSQVTVAGFMKND